MAKSAFSLVVLALLSLLDSDCISGIEGAVLNDYIQDFQPLRFDQMELHSKHTRAKRSVDKQLHWEFSAYDRQFHLILHPSESVFAPGHVLVFGSELAQHVDTSFIYDGVLQDVPGSFAHLSINYAGVRGYILVPGDTTYHVEPARAHVKNMTFHTIIYPESKMDLDPYSHLRNSSCGITDVDWFKEVLKERNRLNLTSLTSVRASHHYRHIRATQGNLLDPNKTTCLVQLQADQFLYLHILGQHTDTPQLSKEQQARDELLSIFASHVTFLNHVVEQTIFHANGQPDPYIKGVRFQLQKTTIITSCETPPYNWESGYCNNNLDVSNFLVMTALRNQNEYCLTHTFTYRDFLQGRLGLAYMGYADASNTGICARFSKTRLSENKIAEISQNTGVVTFVNFQRTVPPVISQLTFVHEVGHNLGALHDPRKGGPCSPYSSSKSGSSEGNFIMYESSSQGSLPNNFLFSDCSKVDIYNVLASFEPMGKKFNCFKSPEESFCGNLVVEGDEECDCGYADTCDPVETCCIGRDDQGNGCTRREDAVCSPTEGPCCAAGCTFQQSTVECQAATECRSVSYCTGNSSVCPTPTSKPDFQEFCDDYSKVCQNGECMASVCKYYGWDECFKTKSEGASDAEMCYVSCRLNATGECVSTLTPNTALQGLLDVVPGATTDKGIRRPPGSPCDAFMGYCDVLFQCKAVDAEGPYLQLLGQIFSPNTWSKVGNWIETYWWATALAVVGLIILVILVIKVFSYNTPSHDPSKPRPDSSYNRHSHDPSKPRPDSSYNRPSYYPSKPRPDSNELDTLPPNLRIGSAKKKAVSKPRDNPYSSNNNNRRTNHDKSNERNNYRDERQKSKENPNTSQQERHYDNLDYQHGNQIYKPPDYYKGQLSRQPTWPNYDNDKHREHGYTMDNFNDSRNQRYSRFDKPDTDSFLQTQSQPQFRYDETDNQVQMRSDFPAYRGQRSQGYSQSEYFPSRLGRSGISGMGSQSQFDNIGSSVYARYY